MSSIAVVIPTYNRSHVLGRALDSVLAQSLPPREVIVVDDGSDDETEQLVADNYPDVIYSYQKNLGVSAARNKGVSLTAAKWIAFLDSDDQWHPDKLEQQMQASVKYPDYRLIHSDENWIRNGVRVNKKARYKKQGGYIFQHCLALCAISPSSVLVQKSLLQELGGFDESLPACEDYDLWLKVCSRYPVLLLDKPLLNRYGGHEDQLSGIHWGLDRYRVIALHRFLKDTECSDKLSKDDLAQARDMLHKKCSILINGAKKRGNMDAVNFYQSLMI